MIIFLGCSGALYAQLETNCPVAANCHSICEHYRIVCIILFTFVEYDL